MDHDTEMLLFDLACAIVLLIVATIGSYLPLRLYTGGERSLAFQLGTLFSGGVMLSAGLVHLLADSVETLAEEVEDYPLGPFLCAMGFLLTLIIDEVVTDYYKDKIGHAHGTRHEPLVAEGGAESDHAPPQLSIYTAVIMALGLCLHSILEGLALGTEDEIKSSLDIAFAIVAHKGLAAYALGACVLDANPTSQVYWTILGIFSIMSPIGVMVGYAISEFSDSITTASLTALASGTFLYVALMEVIPNALQDKSSQKLKLFMLTLGFGLMSIIAIWA